MRSLGQIRQLVVVSNEQGMQLVNLVKSSAEMDLAERRHPLDGRWTYEVDGHKFDFRVNTIGTHWGEDMVLRLLPTDGACLTLAELAWSASNIRTCTRCSIAVVGCCW